MATISSMLKLIDGFTRPIDLSISAMRRMVDAMERLNQSANLPNMDQEFADIRTDISLAEHAAEQLNDDLRRTGDQAPRVQRVASSFRGVSGAIVVLNQGLQLTRTLLNGINDFGERADKRISVDARLNLVNDGSMSQEQLEGAVMQMANESRSRYEDSANMVARMARQDYFKADTASAIRFTETLNKGLVVSGASANEASNALLQLSQGIASGTLRGDEFRSVMENAPVLAEMMAKSMNMTKGQLRELSMDGGLTTEVVVSSIMAQADLIDEQFARMPMTFGQAKNVIGNQVSQLMDYLSQPGQAVDRLITKLQELISYLGTPQGQQMITEIASAINFAADCLSGFFDLLAQTYQFVADNWSWIGPIIGTVAAAIILATAATAGYNAVTFVTSAVQLVAASVKAAFTGATLAATSATAAETAAQWGLNAAMLACPVTWIILAIVLIIGLVYAVIGIINQLTGTTTSATGVICGSIMFAIAAISNIFIAFYNLLVDAVAILYNAFAVFAEFLANVFTDPVGSIVRLFSGMADAVLSILEAIASAVDTLFGSNLADAVSGWRGSLQQMTDDLVGEAAIKVDRMDPNDLKVDRWDPFDAYNSGYQFGQGIDSKIGELFKAPDIPKPEIPDYKGSEYGDEYRNPTGGKIDKVGSVDISEQSLEYLRDIAEEQALRDMDVYASAAYEQLDELRLSDADADLLRASANNEQNLYYLNYSGGSIAVQNEVTRGESWEDIKRRIHEEADDEIETGLSGFDEVVMAW